MELYIFAVSAIRFASLKETRILGLIKQNSLKISELTLCSSISILLLVFFGPACPIIFRANILNMITRLQQSSLVYLRISAENPRCIE